VRGATFRQLRKPSGTTGVSGRQVALNRSLASSGLVSWKFEDWEAQVARVRGSDIPIGEYRRFGSSGLGSRRVKCLDSRTAKL
jgi:hypothetical protein